MAQLTTPRSGPVQLTSPDLRVPEAYKWAGGSMSQTRARDMLLHARRYVVNKLHQWHLPAVELYAIADTVMTLNVALSHVHIELDEKGKASYGNTRTATRKRPR